MAGNAAPIFSRVGSINGSNIPLIAAAADYNGNSPLNAMVFKSDATNGGFIQRLRFKALGTNVLTVARVYLNAGTSGHLASLLTQPTAPTATPSTTGGTLLSASYYAKIVAVDAQGSLSVVGTESAAVVVTGPTGSIPWTWTAVSGASSYRIYVGTASNQESGYFTSSTNSFSQTVGAEGTGWTDGYIGAAGAATTNNFFFGEISLPATAASATAATVDIDYPMNIALPPGYEVYVGLGTAVAAGWSVTAIAGAY